MSVPAINPPPAQTGPVRAPAPLLASNGRLKRISPPKDCSACPRPPGLKQRVSSVVRWLHIYASMFGLAALLFFSVTGFLLNHPDWVFGRMEKELRDKGSVPGNWVGPASKDVHKLEIVEHLRSRHRVRGAVGVFNIADEEIAISFKGPGYHADAYIDRTTGRYELSQTLEGAIAMMNDLHKGNNTGRAWSLVIDITAIILALVSLTGLVMVLFLRKRRKNGVILLSAGAVLCALVLWLCVP